MDTTVTENLQLRSAVQVCAATLHKFAAYELDPILAQRMHQLGENKEFLSVAEHEELLALVDFAQKRTLERLEAQVALERLRAVLPDLFANV